jgi:F5/8 type C domain/PKD domain
VNRYDWAYGAVQSINWCTSPVPTAEVKWTGYPGVGQYPSFDMAYTTDHSVQSPLNLYEWLLTKNKNPATNVPPIANAGVDQTITLPVNSIAPVGSGTDPDGTISTYTWTQLSGSPASVAKANSATLNLTNLTVGTYVFRLTVTDNSGATASDDVNLTVNPAITSGTNLALAKPVVTSSYEWWGLAGTGAVDGDYGTRWSSAWSDLQWIYVDLGLSVNINRVKITWEIALAYNYKVQVSTDAITWVDMKTITANTSLVNDHTGLNETGRYVRVLCIARGTNYGYSIFELEVYGNETIAAVNARTSTTTSKSINAATQSTAMEEVVGLVFLDKKYLGENNYSVIIFNSDGEKVLNGKWNNDMYQDTFSREGLYIYHILQAGKRIDSGKLLVSR